MTEDKRKPTTCESLGRMKYTATDMPPTVTFGAEKGDYRRDPHAIVVRGDSGASLYAAIRSMVDPLGGVELNLPQRELMRDPLDFGE